jgi:hypothetical protein
MKKRKAAPSFGWDENESSEVEIIFLLVHGCRSWLQRLCKCKFLGGMEKLVKKLGPFPPYGYSYGYGYAFWGGYGAVLYHTLNITVKPYRCDLAYFLFTT